MFAGAALHELVTSAGGVERVLVEACTLLGIPPVAAENTTAAAGAGVVGTLRDELAATLPAAGGAPAHAAWLAELYDALHEVRATTPSARRPRAFGEHYTPPALAEELTAACLAPLLAACETVADLLALRLLEPAAGTGAFVCALFSHLAEHVVRTAELPQEEAVYALLEAGTVTGIERDPLAAAVTQRVVALRFAQANTRQVWELLAARIRCVDALETTPSHEKPHANRAPASKAGAAKAEAPAAGVGGAARSAATSAMSTPRSSLTPKAAQPAPGSGCPVVAPQSFDAVITNPPFLFQRDVPPAVRQRLEGGYVLAQEGQWDLYWLFAERALTYWLTTTGRSRLGLLLPEAVLARDESARLRRFLLEQLGELELWPLGLRFAGAQTGIVALTATKRGPSGSGQAQREPAGFCTLHAASHRKAAPAQRIPLATLWRSPGCRFVAPPAQVSRACRSASGVTLGELAQISRGEEVGKRSLRPLEEGACAPPGHLAVLTGASLAVPLARPRPSHVMPEALARKPAARYAPPSVVVAKTGREVHAAVERDGYRCLQSVYTLRLSAAAPGWWSHELLCALLVAEATQAAWIRPVTWSKQVFPQITQSLLKQIELPQQPPSPRLAGPLAEVLASAPNEPVPAKAKLDELIAAWLTECGH